MMICVDEPPPTRTPRGGRMRQQMTARILMSSAFSGFCSTTCCSSLMGFPSLLVFPGIFRCLNLVFYEWLTDER